ncbi:hypothetical protein [Dickeya chrysanthemi]|uniref:hypothetical protein n=1 Tax=Dickeya chrysanthemi TaxID=556 RepID=UPI0003A7A94F|nr:hypothetical protein [Dickeya chrysanthemi]
MLELDKNAPLNISPIDLFDRIRNAEISSARSVTNTAKEGTATTTNGRVDFSVGGKIIEAAIKAFQGNPLVNVATGMEMEVSSNTLDKMISAKAVGK